MRYFRLALQIFALTLQTYFFILIYRAFLSFMGGQAQSSWSNMLLSILVFIACEVISGIDAFIYVISAGTKYSIVYLIGIFLNAILFSLFCYRENFIGTVVCLGLYSLFYFARIVSFIFHVRSIGKRGN